LPSLTRREAGRKRVGWPSTLGGYGIWRWAAPPGDPYDELAWAGIEIPDTDLSNEVIAPAMLHFAPAMAEAYLPRFLAREDAWAQAFSELGVGSDLASLQTRGVINGNEVVVDGQKVWTSHGHLAARLLTLVRTGSSESRHRGLAAMLIDAVTPRVTRNPLIFASGVDEMCETFFNGVRVPIDRMVGSPDRGWTVAMFMHRIIDIAADQVSTRRQFKCPIGTNQSVRFRLAAIRPTNTTAIPAASHFLVIVRPIVPVAGESRC
jgi:hypothetical protein